VIGGVVVACSLVGCSFLLRLLQSFMENLVVVVAQQTEITSRLSFLQVDFGIPNQQLLQV
jgi:hypothetical protein